MRQRCCPGRHPARSVTSDQEASSEAILIVHPSSFIVIPLLRPSRDPTLVVDPISNEETAMIAIILAAGAGTRLGSLGEELPKCLLPIGDRSPLELYARAFERAGVVDEVIVVGGYRIDAVRERLPAGFRLIENRDYASTNSLASLLLALESIPDRDIVVLNADVIYQSDLLGRFLRSPRRTALLIDELRAFDPREFQVRVVDGLVRELGPSISAEASFGEDAQCFKVSAEDLPSIRADARAALEAGGATQYASRVLLGLIARERVHPVYTHQEVWSEFDTAEDYQRCVELASSPEAGSPDYGAYGLNDGPPPPDPDTAPPEDPRSAVQRLWACASRGELPWRVRWLPEVPAAFRHAPIPTLRAIVPLLTQSLPPEGFRMRVYGSQVLSDLMASAAAVEMRPFLLWGTLLGCVREQRFIRNDHDIDVGVFDAEYQRITELTREMVARGYTIRKESTVKVSYMHPHGRLWVDIDRVFPARDHFWITEAPSERPVIRAYWFARHTMGTLVARRFEGVEALIPDGAEEILHRPPCRDPARKARPRPCRRHAGIRAAVCRCPKL